MTYNNYIKLYNEHSDVNFKYELINKYDINFYSDDNTQKYIILTLNSKSLWCEYKIICSVDIVSNYILWVNDMIAIEKSIKANSNIKNEYMKSDKKINIEEFLLNQTIKYKYIGLVSFNKNNVKYYFFVEKIIKL
jgi:hypothetical protein